MTHRNCIRSFTFAFLASFVLSIATTASAGSKEAMDGAVKKAKEAAIEKIKTDGLKDHGAAFVVQMTFLCVETRSELGNGFTAKATAAVRCENTNQHKRDKSAYAYAYIVKSTYGDGNPPVQTEIDPKTFIYDEKTDVVQVNSMVWSPEGYWYVDVDNSHWRNSQNSGGENHNEYRFLNATSVNVFTLTPGTYLYLYEYVQVSDGNGNFRSKPSGDDKGAGAN